MPELCKWRGYVKVGCPYRQKGCVCVCVLENSLCNCGKHNVRFYDLIRRRDNAVLCYEYEDGEQFRLFTLLMFYSKCCQVVPQTVRGYLYRL